MQTVCVQYTHVQMCGLTDSGHSDVSPPPVQVPCSKPHDLPQSHW